MRDLLLTRVALRLRCAHWIICGILLPLNYHERTPIVFIRQKIGAGRNYGTSQARTKPRHLQMVIQTVIILLHVSRAEDWASQNRDVV